jgi:hypothetical protein
MTTDKFEDDDDLLEQKSRIPLTEIKDSVESIYGDSFEDDDDILDYNKSFMDRTKNSNEYDSTLDYILSEEYLTKDLPRGLKLGTRSVLQGISGGTGIDLLANPIRGGMNLFRDEDNQIPPKGLGQQIGDLMDLPYPETPVEKIGSTVTEFATGGGSMASLANKLKKPLSIKSPMATQSTLAQQSVNNIKQALPNILGGNLNRATAGGGAFGGAFEGIEQFGQEMIPNKFARDVVKFGGGIGASAFFPGVGANLLNRVSNITNKVKQIPKAFKPRNLEKAELVLDDVVRIKGMSMEELPPGVRESLLNRIDDILNQGGTVKRREMERLLDYELTGTQPTVGTLNRDPAQVTAEQNLAKLAEGQNGPNSLASIKNQNNNIIIESFDDMGAELAKPTKEAGEEVFGLFSTINDKFKAVITSLYKKAIDSNGRSAWYDARLFNEKLMQRLKNENMLDRLPDVIKKEIARYTDDPQSFTIDAKSNFQSNIARDMRKALRDADDNSYQALKTVRDELENIKLGEGQSFGKEANKAINDAKKASYEYNKMQDKIPALSDFRNPKVNSEDFFEKFFIRSKGDDFVASYNSLDDAGKEIIKNNLLGHIKRAMTGDTTNDFAKVSAKGLERVLKNIGKKKLEAVFTKAELRKIHALKNVAKSDSFMPVGSAVNTSNTASTLTKDFGGKIPFLQNIINNRKVNKAIDVDNNAIKEIISRPDFLSKPGLLYPLFDEGNERIEDGISGLLN